MKGWKAVVTALGLAGMLGGSVPLAALAASPEFARTAEEWERLKDNKLEYGEIADLVHEYNVTVQNNQYEYNEFIKDYGKTRDDVANAYRDLADDLEAEMTGEDGMGLVGDFQLEQQAKRMREQADDNLEDSQIYYWNYSQAEDNLVLSAQSKFLSYYKSGLELQAAESKKKLLDSSYALAQMKRQAGTATDAEVLEASEAVLEQEKTIAELEQQRENTRKSLIVMCGWKESNDPEIGELPQIELSDMDSIDLETDKQTALEKNYTLMINKKKLENAQAADTKEKLQKNIASNERQIALSVTNAWQNLQTAKRSWQQAAANQETAARNDSLAQQKWNAGMITQYEYERQKNELNSAKISFDTAYLELIEAYETYCWNVNGLAGAE